MRATISALEETIVSRLPVLVKHVAFDRDKLIIQIETEGAVWEVSICSPVGFRVLDERDMPEFWHSQCESCGDVLNAVVSEVNDGWMACQKEGAMISQAFYGDLREYLVGGEDYCVNVLSTHRPTISRNRCNGAA